jgi:hypothetical protein
VVSLSGGAGFVIIAMIAEEADIDRGEERKDGGLNQPDEQFHEIENENETGSMEKVFTAKDVAEEPH